MIKKVTGIVHGKTIEFSEELGVADGEQVEVTITQTKVNPNWGEGILRSAGALADDWTEEDDKILEQIYQSRHSDSRPEIQ